MKVRNEGGHEDFNLERKHEWEKTARSKNILGALAQTIVSLLSHYLSVCADMRLCACVHMLNMKQAQLPRPSDEVYPSLSMAVHIYHPDPLYTLPTIDTI